MPTSPSHPLIDRAAVARHCKRRHETCPVLYQDKINADGMPAAVQALNAAATAFKGQYTQILCVASVTGASELTRAQDKFRFPYLLVRDGEVAKYYTPTFAPAIRFVRARHVISDPRLTTSKLERSLRLSRKPRRTGKPQKPRR
jgi:hypothetical protein